MLYRLKYIQRNFFAGNWFLMSLVPPTTIVTINGSTAPSASCVSCCCIVWSQLTTAMFNKTRKRSMAKQTLCARHSNKSTQEFAETPRPSSESKKGFKGRVIGTCNNLRDRLLSGRRRRSQPARCAHDQAEHEENCKSNQLLRRGRSLNLTTSSKTIRKLSAEGRLGAPLGKSSYGTSPCNSLSPQDRTECFSGASYVSTEFNAHSCTPSDSNYTCRDCGIENSPAFNLSPKMLPKGRPARQAKTNPYPSPPMPHRKSVTSNIQSNAGIHQNIPFRGRRKALCQVQDDYIRGLMLARKNSRNTIDWGSTNEVCGPRIPERKCSSHGYYHCLNCSLWIVTRQWCSQLTLWSFRWLITKERRNSSALAPELRLLRIKPSIFHIYYAMTDKVYHDMGAKIHLSIVCNCGLP